MRRDVKGEVHTFVVFVVARFGKENVEPHVRAMEEAGRYKPELIKAIFDQGVRREICHQLFNRSFSELVVDGN